MKNGFLPFLLLTVLMLVVATIACLPGMNEGRLPTGLPSTTSAFSDPFAYCAAVVTV